MCIRDRAHTVLASDLINEQLALLAGLKEEQMGLGHAFEDVYKRQELGRPIATSAEAREMLGLKPRK